MLVIGFLCIRGVHPDLGGVYTNNILLTLWVQVILDEVITNDMHAPVEIAEAACWLIHCSILFSRCFSDSDTRRCQRKEQGIVPFLEKSLGSGKATNCI